MLDVLIVGAGLSGLMAGRLLQNAGYTVQVVDKGRSVGGRLATRRMGEGRADHGAQFFSVRSPQFQSYVDDWLRQDWVYIWSRGWGNGSLDTAPADGYPRYAVRQGMNQLAKKLAQGLDVAVNVELTGVQAGEKGWQAQTGFGESWQARALILTPPVPQSLALLAAGDVALAHQDGQALAQIVYAPCVAGLFRLSGPADLPDPGALQRATEAYSWIADNQRKGISPDAPVVTVHAGPTWSRILWEWPPEEALAHIQTHGLTPFLGPTVRVEEAQIKRWRYALPEITHPDPYVQAATQPAPLFFAGDAFGGPRVEGAALSGLAVGQALADVLRGV